MPRAAARFPLLLFSALLLAAVAVPRHSAIAQNARREVRGVWLTTLLGLDWPAASLRGNVDAQKQALREILDDLQQRHYNTVFFQVRSRGNAMYRSAYEPWASELTGTLGRDPGWDPLAFAIEECHARGLQLHAWFNVCRVWSKGEPPASTPAHIARLHPEWVQRFGDDLWIDAGIPAARAYTVQVAEDMVRNYAVDGLHFDYVRYPDRGFKDDDTYHRHGSGKPIDDWRRDNISAFVRDAYQRCTAVRPALQVGSAPIGIYQNLPTAKGWEGRNAIYQDSRRWLREGYHDYVVPQIYWGLKRRGSNIDFEALVDDWKANASGRQVYAGVAAYKDNVQPWLADHVDATRDHGADGVVFFRYEHVKGNAMAGRFDRLSIPPAMTWRDPLRPNPPMHLRDENGSLAWDAPVTASDGDAASWYAVYRRSATEAEDQLAALLPASRLQWPLPSGSTADNFAVTALDAFWNESATAGAGVTLAQVEETLPAPSMPVFEPRISTPQSAGAGIILLGYELGQPAFVRLRLMDGNGAEALVLVDGWQGAGTHMIGIERDRLPDDVRRYIFEAGDLRSIMEFTPEN
ncbi:MAG: family 10 glycosylhydrolase [Bacteroidetes bacterium]|nr:family 10 glycosylhydrolase [Bacteroidota bacterium]